MPLSVRQFGSSLVSMYAKNIRASVTRELVHAAEAEARQLPALAFRHLERAHVLGQHSTREHLRAHLHMLRWGIRHRLPKEVFGQLLRILGAVTKTAIGWVPAGNTGGANVSPFKTMPVDPDLHAIMMAARRPRKS